MEGEYIIVMVRLVGQDFSSEDFKSVTSCLAEFEMPISHAGEMLTWQIEVRLVLILLLPFMKVFTFPQCLQLCGSPHPTPPSDCEEGEHGWICKVPD